MAKQTGAISLKEVATELCRLVTKFQNVILELTDNDPLVAAALAAALVACQQLQEALAPYIQANPLDQ